MTDLIAWSVEQAPLDAKENYGVALDFSDGSVEKIEVILGKLARHVKDKNNFPPGMRGMGIMYGIYIGECIVRNHGGKWGKDDPTVGNESWPVSYDGHNSFPIGWCVKRLANGDVDNVWHKYQFFVLKKKEIPGHWIEVVPGTGDGKKP